MIKETNKLMGVIALVVMAILQTAVQSSPPLGAPDIDGSRLQPAQAPLPVITGFSPASGAAGTSVTLAGRNFQTFPVAQIPYQICFSGRNGPLIPARIISRSPTSVNVEVPVGAITGRIFIKVLGLIGSRSAADFVVVPLVRLPVLRIQNASQYDLVDLRINGVQQLNAPFVVRAGDALEVPTTAGNCAVEAGLGFYDLTRTVQTYFQYSLTVNVAANGTTPLTFNRVTVGQLLTLSSSGAFQDWTGHNIDPFDPHTYTLRIFRNGTWLFFDNGTQRDSGTLIETSWPHNAQFVRFKLKQQDPEVIIGAPFNEFEEFTVPCTFRR